jgi:hypothetical protein
LTKRDSVINRPWAASQGYNKIKIKSIIFWDVTQCSLLSYNRRFGGTYRLHLQGLRNHFSKNQQASRWQGATQQTTRRHVPEDDTLHNERCENLKSYKIKIISMNEE